MKLNVLFSNFEGHAPRPPLKGLSWVENIFGHSAFKIELLALRSEASTEGILSNKCLLLVEYKQFQKRRTKGITQCILATDKSTIFSRAARISSNLVFTIYCAIIPGRALYMGGGWLDCLGSGILVGKRYFQKY